MIRLIKYLLLLLIVLAIVLPFVVVVAGLQPYPLVPVASGLTASDIQRAEALMRKYDPRGSKAGEVRSLEVPEGDLALMLDYGIGRLVPAGAEVDLHRGAATISLTAEVPENPLGRYFNLGMDLVQFPGGVEIEGLRFGVLQVPSVIARGVGWLAHQALQRDETYQTVLASLNGFRVTEDRLVVVYQWQPDLVDRVKSRALVVDNADRERLLAYSARIASATQASLIPGEMRLTELMEPVFREARERSDAGGEAAAENRAAIIALMLYVQGVDVARLLSEPADDAYRAKARTLTLQGRDDFAQHFLISAGIAASGGSRLANAVGLFKEIDDSRGGSGFSFTDLAADRAGVRFAEAATGSNAARIQDLLADGARESDFMPEARDLPELMSEEELLRRFGGVGAPGYRQVVDDIEDRIGALTIHRR
jgi:hypothetical protein